MATSKQTVVTTISGDAEYKGDTVFACDIPPNVTLTIKGGKAKFEGAIYDGVTVKCEGDGSANVRGATVSVSGGSVTGVSIVGRNSKVIINGVDVSAQLNKASGNSDVSPEAGNVEVMGAVGNGVTIKADGYLRLNDDAGERFTARSIGPMHLISAGDYADLDATGKVSFDAVGAYSRIESVGGVRGNEVGRNSEIESTGSVRIDGDVHDYTDVDAVGSIKVRRAFKDVSLKAVGSAKADASDPSATFNAVGSTKRGKEQTLSVGEKPKTPKTPPEDPNRPKLRVVKRMDGKK